MSLRKEIGKLNWAAIFFIFAIGFLVVFMAYISYLSTLDPYVLKSCDLENDIPVCFYYNFYNNSDVRVVKELLK